MGDDRIVAIDRAHEFGDHAVLVDRHLVGGELRRPLGKPLFFDRGDLILQLAERRAWLGLCSLTADLLDQRVDDEAGVADEAECYGVILVDVAGVVGRVDDGLAGRYARPERRPGQARADGENEVGARHEFRVHFRPRAGGGAERQRMALRDRALTGIGGGDRGRDQLGEGCKPLAGAGVVHALAGPQQRVFCCEQHAHGVLHRRRIGRKAHRHDGGIVERALIFGIPHVVRDLDQHRTTLAGAHRVIGAPHQVGQLLHRMRECGPFRHRT